MSDSTLAMGRATSRRQGDVVRIVWMLVALVLGLTTIFPLFWMISIAFKPAAEVFRPGILPVAPTGANFLYVFTEVPFLKYLGNTFFVSSVITVVALFFHTMNGNLKEAARHRDIYLAAHPDFRLADYMFPQSRPEDRKHYLEGLRRAGFV